MAASQGTFVKFCPAPVYSKIETGAYSISDLPLMELHGKGKKFKEFFQAVHDVTPAQQQQIREVMNSENPRLVDLPANVRPGDAVRPAICSSSLILPLTRF